MARPRATPRPPPKVPILAMVDAFVGGVAILLILIILSSSQQETEGTQPRADLTLRCTQGVITALDPPDWTTAPPPDMTPLIAATWLAAHPRPDRLLLRVRLEADMQEYRCATGFQRAAEGMNEATDDTTGRDIAQERAFLMVALVLTESAAPAEAVE